VLVRRTRYVLPKMIFNSRLEKSKINETTIDWNIETLSSEELLVTTLFNKTGKIKWEIKTSSF
jgi:hypothetical protein